MPVEDYIDSLLSPRRPRRRSFRPSLTPEQKTSLIGRVGGEALSGLSALGNLLDVPGSMVRDVFAGENPFDQLLDPLGRRAEQNRVTGRELLRRGGAVGRRDTWGNFAGGLGAEILTDPLSYLTFGMSALGKAGKAAQAAGTLERGLAKQIAAGQRGLIGARLPFSSNVLEIGTGKTAQKIAGGIDTAVEGAKYSRPGRFISSLMDWQVGGTKTKPVQELARNLVPERHGEIAKARTFAAQTARRLIDDGLVESKHGDALRRVLEGTGTAEDAALGFNSQMVSDIITENEDILRQAQDLGMDVEALRDATGLRYFQRFQSAEGGTTKWRGRVLATTDPSELGRKWYMKDIQGGTDVIQRIARDSDIEKLISEGTAKPAGIRDKIVEKFGDVFMEGEHYSSAKRTMVRHTAKQHGEAFVNSLMGMGSDVRKAGVFGNHPVADMMHGMTSRRDAITVSRGIIDFLNQPGMLSDVPAPGFTPVSDLMQTMKLSGSALAESAKFLPEEIAKDLVKLHEGFTRPESVNGLIQIIDNITNLFKAGVTGVWPAFHTRNLVSGQWQNFVGGMFDASSVSAAGKMLKGETVQGAAKIPVVAAELARRGLAGDEAGTKVLADLAFAHDIIGKYQGQAVDVAGGAAQPGVQTLDDLIGDLPGAVPTKGLVGHAIDLPTYTGARQGLNLKPWDVRGVGERTASTFGPAKWGENLGHTVEGLNRLSPFINQLKKGVDPTVAAQKVGAAQVLYQSRYYTPFEREALARLFPFFKFSSRAIPWNLRMLADQPGGVLAQTLRGINRGRDPNEVTPDWVSETAAVPLGRDAEGTQRFLTGFGLPIEDTLSLVNPASLKSSGMEMLSRTNPFIKAPLEWLTGQSFFQRSASGGRPLEDLDPTIGRTVANVGEYFGGERPRRAEPIAGSAAAEFVLANSPLSRLLTGVRTLTDPRKGAGAKASNLLTGFRVSDVSPAAQDAILRERTMEAMKGMGGRTFERTSIPDEVIASLPPDQQVLALRYRALLNELAQRAKARRSK